MNTKNSGETATLLVSLGVKQEKLFVADDRLDADEALPPRKQTFFLVRVP